MIIFAAWKFISTKIENHCKILFGKIAGSAQ